jgi:hypothetical protein
MGESRSRPKSSLVNSNASLRMSWHTLLLVKKFSQKTQKKPTLSGITVISCDCIRQANHSKSGAQILNHLCKTNDSKNRRSAF